MYALVSQGIAPVSVSCWRSFFLWDDFSRYSLRLSRCLASGEGNVKPIDALHNLLGQRKTQEALGCLRGLLGKEARQLGNPAIGMNPDDFSVLGGVEESAYWKVEGYRLLAN
jgi:hypothetical protein